MIASATLFGSCTADTDAINMPPTIETGDATDLTRTAAKVAGSITANGSTVDSYGIIYSSSSYQMLEGTTTLTCSEPLESGKTFTLAMSGLKSGTTYFYRTYAVSGGAYAYGPYKSLQTPSISAPTIGTPSCTSSQANEAEVTAFVTDKGVSEDVALDLVSPTVMYKRLGDASWSGSTVSISQDAKDWQTANAEFDDADPMKIVGTITGLSSSSTYAVYVTATCAGQGRSVVSTVVTGETSSPEVSAITIDTKDDLGQNITFHAAVTNTGKSATGGTATIEKRGFVYSETNLTPEVGGNGCTLIEATGNDSRFSASLSGLLNSRTYYIRAYAMNELGEKDGYGYGAVYTHTAADGLPKLTSISAMEITETSARIVAYIEANGSQIKERGFYLNDQKFAISGTGSGLFDYVATGLAPQSQNSFYAYCVTTDNKQHVGQTISFKTLSAPEPVVETITYSDLTETSVRLVGSVDPNGLEIVECGFLVDGQKHIANAVSGTFEVLLNDLTPTSSHSFQAYCMTNDGKQYTGGKISFSTKQLPVPVVRAVTYSGLTDTSVTLVGHVYENGRSIDQYGFVINGQTYFVSNVEDGTYTYQATGLTPQTSYKVHAICVTSDGITYSGKETTITTEASSPNLEDILFPGAK